MDHNRGDHDHQHPCRDHRAPAEHHDLIVADTRDRPAERDREADEEHGLGDEDSELDEHREETSRFGIGQSAQWEVVSAEEEEHEEGGVQIELEQIRFDINGELAIADGPFEKINVFAGFADYEHKEIEPSGEVGTIFSNEGHELRTELIQRTSGEWKAAYGLQYKERDFSAVGEEAFTPPTSSEQFGIYTYQSSNAGDWHLEGAARYETTTHKNKVTDEELDFDGYSFSLGADYHLSDSWRAGVTTFLTKRAPTTEELFAEGPHLATGQYERGDSTLSNETARGVEASVRYRGEGASLTLNVFRTDYDNYIFLDADGSELDELPVFLFQAEDTVFNGFEFVGQFEHGEALGANWYSDVTIERVEAIKDVDGNDNLPFLPPLGILAGLEADIDGYNWRFEVDHLADQESIAINEIPTDSSTQYNAFLSFAPFESKPSLKVRMAVQNITDEEVRQHSSNLKDVAPLPGRNFKISLEKSF